MSGKGARWSQGAGEVSQAQEGLDPPDLNKNRAADGSRALRCSRMCCAEDIDCTEWKTRGYSSPSWPLQDRILRANMGGRHARLVCVGFHALARDKAQDGTL